MTLLAFVQANLSRRLTAPGGLGGQCVDAVNVYLHDVYGMPPVRADAVNWEHATLPGWRWVPNSPTNSPTIGAIVVWGLAPAVGVGALGHVAVALVADSMILVTVDQNWPEAAPLRVVVHSYVGVRGWWAPPHVPTY